MRRFRAAALVVGALSAPLVVAAPVGAAYAAKVAFKRNVPVRFPDFELTYTGERYAASPELPRGFQVHDFRLVRGKGSMMVSWTAGTGEIGPVRFTVGTMVYALELLQSEKLGKLRKDEMVVSKVP